MEMGRRYVAIYATFGRELDAWSMMVAPDDWPESLVRQLMQVTLRLLGQIDLLARELDLDSLPESVRRKVGALLWSTLNGLAEQYSGVRHQLHRVPLDEMLAFAARMLGAAGARVLIVARSGDRLAEVAGVINGAGGWARRSIELSYDRFHDYQRTIGINYLGPVKLMLGVLPTMRRRRAR